MRTDRQYVRSRVRWTALHASTLNCPHSSVVHIMSQAVSLLSWSGYGKGLGNRPFYPATFSTALFLRSQKLISKHLQARMEARTVWLTCKHPSRPLWELWTVLDSTSPFMESQQRPLWMGSPRNCFRLWSIDPIYEFTVIHKEKPQACHSLQRLSNILLSSRAAQTTSNTMV